MVFSVWALSRVLACLAGGIVIQCEKVLAAFTLGLLLTLDICEANKQVIISLRHNFDQLA